MSLVTTTEIFVGESQFATGVRGMEQERWAVRQIVTYVADATPDAYSPRRLVRHFAVVFEQDGPS